MVHSIIKENSQTAIGMRNLACAISSMNASKVIGIWRIRDFDLETICKELYTMKLNKLQELIQTYHLLLATT